MNGRGKMKILGLDEAGRGCVLGPLVVGAFCCSEEKLEELVQTGATDSKKLSAKKRERILKLLPAVGEIRLHAITPAEIDGGNINALEEEAFISHILHFRPERVYIDAPTHPKGIPAVAARIRRALEPHMPLPELVIEPKADLTYPVAGAASIAAKVSRDEAIHSLGPVGSGYPSDPVTRAWLTGFLRRGEEFPDCVRKRWGTIQNLRQQSLL
jgi:ribonuclease HII